MIVLSFVNPNKAGLFEGSFFLGGGGGGGGGRLNLALPQNPPTPPFIFQEDLVKYQYNFIQLLKKIYLKVFKVCLKCPHHFL